MYIALVQFNPTTAALRKNAEDALSIIDELACLPYPPDLVVFPAFALTGANVAGLVYHDAFAAECVDVTREFVTRAKLPTLFGTLIPRPLEDQFSFICEPEAVFCHDGLGGALGFVDIYNQWHHDHYASSIDFEIDGHTITVLLDDYPDNEDDFSHSDVVVMMLAKEYEGTSSLFTSSTQIRYLRSIAQQNRSWLLVSNLTGGEDDAVFDGASIVFDNKGRIIDSADAFAEQVLVVNLELSGKVSEKEQADEDLELTQKKDMKVVKPLLPYEADWGALTLSLRDYVYKNGFEDVILGLSGGIDSACVAALAVDTLGAEHVQGILMPGPYTSQNSIDDALLLSELLGINTSTIPITEAYALIKRGGDFALGQEASSLAQENLQARLRMVYLMYLANHHGWLLLNTGNKSENAVGYSTLYGDTAGSFAPLGNYYKTDIYGLIAWRNSKSRIIPQTIVDKEPSAELREGQKDTDSLPSYDVLDRILRLHIEDDYGVDQILETAYQQSGEPSLDPSVVISVLEMVKRAEFKRRQEPLSPALGTVALNSNRAWPITNGFSDYDRRLIARADLYDFLNTIYKTDGPGATKILEN